MISYCIEQILSEGWKFEDIPTNEYWIYKVCDQNLILYIGCTTGPQRRIREHLGHYPYADIRMLGFFINIYESESEKWRVEFYQPEECINNWLDEKNVHTIATERILREGEEMMKAKAFATETAMINLFRPCLNVQDNKNPTPIPLSYKCAERIRRYRNNVIYNDEILIKQYEANRFKFLKVIDNAEKKPLSTTWYEEEWKINKYTNVLITNPKDVSSYILRARSHQNNKDYLAAINDYNNAIELNYNDDYLYYERGQVYLLMEDYNLAIADFSQCIQMKSGFFNVYNERGNVYRQIKNWELAIIDYNRAIKLEPRKAIAYYNRGLVYKALRNIASAQTDFQKAISLGYNEAKKEL